MGIQRKSALAVGVVALFGVGAVSGLAVANGSGTKLRADLSGANEVPPADPDGDGRAKIEMRIDGPNGQVCFSVRFDDTGTPHRGHIHTGAAGVNGGIVVPLFELAPPQNPTGATDPRNDELESRRRLEGCVTAAPSIIDQITADPDLFYVNLHNARFPAGAIRGQLG